MHAAGVSIELSNKHRKLLQCGAYTFANTRPFSFTLLEKFTSAMSPVRSRLPLPSLIIRRVTPPSPLRSAAGAETGADVATILKLRTHITHAQTERQLSHMFSVFEYTVELSASMSVQST
jgi:hypothetical protein